MKWNKKSGIISINDIILERKTAMLVLIKPRIVLYAQKNNISMISSILSSPQSLMVTKKLQWEINVMRQLD